MIRSDKFSHSLRACSEEGGACYPSWPLAGQQNCGQNYPNQSAIGGYDYTFVDEIPAKYHCQICSYVLRDARLTVCCGQHFCDLCLKQWSAQGSRLTCPYCRQEGFGSVLNKALIREINEFRVKCTNHQKGCDWVGELGGLNKHIESDDGCGFEIVKCKNAGFRKILVQHQHHVSQRPLRKSGSNRTECGEECERRFLAQHEIDCKFRQCRCQHCGHVNTSDAIAGSGTIHLQQSTVNSHPDGSNHYAVCGQYPVECPNNCGAKAIKRKDIPHHRETCPLEPLDCPFSNVGGSVEALRRDIDSHCQTNTQAHLLLMMKSHDELILKNEELVHKNKELQRQSQSIMRRLEALERSGGHGGASMIGPWSLRS